MGDFEEVGVFLEIGDYGKWFFHGETMEDVFKVFLKVFLNKNSSTRPSLTPPPSTLTKTLTPMQNKLMQNKLMQNNPIFLILMQNNPTFSTPMKNPMMLLKISVLLLLLTR